MKKFIILFLFVTIISGNKTLQSKEIGKKPLPKFEEVNKDIGIYIVRYSNIIVQLEGKTIKVPIFGGTYEDITYEDIKKQQTKNRSVLGHIYIEAEKNQIKKTFFEILSFYKKTFFKEIDTNRPSVIGNEGGESLFIWYDFNYEGMPCSMMITVSCDSMATNKKMNEIKSKLEKGERLEETIDMLEFKEDSKWIDIQINLGEESGFKKK